MDWIELVKDPYLTLVTTLICVDAGHQANNMIKSM